MHRAIAIGLLLLATACVAPGGTQRQVVFFQGLSAALDENATAAVANAADAAKKYGFAPVTVIGYADPAGSEAANIALSRARADAVAQALVGSGIPATRIAREAKGETAYVANSLESRRVEIIVGKP